MVKDNLTRNGLRENRFLIGCIQLQIYSITIDGNNGNVIRGDVPAWRKITARSFFLIPAFTAILAGTWWPLLIIAAAGTYVYDMVQSSSVLPPHRWAQGRLERWFGGRV